MGYTIAEKILAEHAGCEVTPGQIVNVPVDMAMANELSAALAIKELNNWGIDKLADSDKVCLIPDHFSPAKDINAAGIARVVRDFARKHDVRWYLEVGRAGIEHAVLPMEGIIMPGQIMVGGDSHTCTAGAVNSFSTGVGSTDIAAAWATGEVWLKVPQSARLTYTGKLRPHVYGKDMILHTLKDLGTAGATYMAIEFQGEVFEQLPIWDRFTMANMAIEAGAKTGLFQFDDKTKELVESTPRYKSERPEYTIASPDADAVYALERTYDVTDLEPQVACPFSPDNVKNVSDVKDVKIDQVVIGSCTNGWLEDLQHAAEMFKGRSVHPDVRVIILPGSQKIARQAFDMGLPQIFIDAGCVFSTSTCGPCIGGHMGVLGEKEVCVSTTNRNFAGRMGHLSSEVYLTNPSIAAASAVLGRVGSPEEL
ncbi:MAG: 3-isopropylmalate dehydratase large subunit [candidate division Zixibacteria bacterium]|nr:3-isopropylmalate dehydratase large subunit [candidate division Zixibacteria bacterium]MDH3938178.1 3-isopropylmalate dehydratase large subunit [candidate division Zixibacteria bacterium]MDH4034936.1 3-isopropylmalate dehydratase large subunit [candidate division Zixibacteria bacterium]